MKGILSTIITFLEKRYSNFVWIVFVRSFSLFKEVVSYFFFNWSTNGYIPKIG